MKKSLGWGFLILVIILSSGFLFFSKRNKNSIPTTKSGEEGKMAINSSNMKLSSSAFNNQGKIPSRYTCDAENVSPPLVISNIPAGTQNLVLIIDDPDSPSGNWTHWLLWNIDPATTEIKEGQVPAGAVQGVNDFGKNEYGGPCPPLGTHRYQFKLYALNFTLNLSPESKKKDLEATIKDYVIGQDILTGLYKRR